MSFEVRDYIEESDAEALSQRIAALVVDGKTYTIGLDRNEWKQYEELFNIWRTEGVEADSIGLSSNNVTYEKKSAYGEGRQLYEQLRKANENKRISNEGVGGRVSISSNNVTYNGTGTGRVGAEQVRNENELKRVSNEGELTPSSYPQPIDTNKTEYTTPGKGRVGAEQTRVYQENERVSKEKTRISNENTRKTNEGSTGTVIDDANDTYGVTHVISGGGSGRLGNEQVRIENEKQRIDDEKYRIDNEGAEGKVTLDSNNVTHSGTGTGRMGAEQIRNANEETRKTNEGKGGTLTLNSDGITYTSSGSGRVAKEQERIENEKVRVSNEKTRISSENTRISSENTRISSENTRISNENTRQSIINGIKEKINNVTLICEPNNADAQNGQLKFYTKYLTVNSSNNVVVSDNNLICTVDMDSLVEKYIGLSYSLLKDNANKGATAYNNLEKYFILSDSSGENTVSIPNWKVGSSSTPIYFNNGYPTTVTSIDSSLLPTASTSTAGIIKIGTGATDAAAGNHSHTLPVASTSTAGIIKIGTGSSDAAAGNHGHSYAPSSHGHSIAGSNNPIRTGASPAILIQGQKTQDCDITFSPAFPSGCVPVVLISQLNGTTNVTNINKTTVTISPPSVTNTGFKVYFSNDNSFAVNFQIYYMAVCNSLNVS